MGIPSLQVNLSSLVNILTLRYDPNQKPSLPKYTSKNFVPSQETPSLEKTMTAPVTAIIAFDIDFHKHLPKLFPHDLDAQNWFNYSQEVAYTNAFRNSSIQGGYFIIAARMLGLDCGPMSGFDQNGLDKEFFPNSSIKSNFLCNIGYGDPTNIFKRSPRFEFDEVCEIL